MGEKPRIEHKKMAWNPNHLLLRRFSLSDFLWPSKRYISCHHFQVSSYWKKTCNTLTYLQFSKAVVAWQFCRNRKIEKRSNKLLPKLLALKRSSFFSSPLLVCLDFSARFRRSGLQPKDACFGKDSWWCVSCGLGPFCPNLWAVQPCLKQINSEYA